MGLNEVWSTLIFGLDIEIVSSCSFDDVYGARIVVNAIFVVDVVIIGADGFGSLVDVNMSSKVQFDLHFFEELFVELESLWIFGAGVMIVVDIRAVDGVVGEYDRKILVAESVDHLGCKLGLEDGGEVYL